MARRDFKKNVMSQQPWFVFTIILSVLLLAGCNLPRTKKAAPATQTPILPSKMAETWTPVVTPKLTDTFTPATLTPITLMVAPAGVKTEVLPAGEVQSSPPSGFRKLLVYPVGGMEGLTECDNSATAPVFQNAPPQIHALTQDFEENNFVTCGWKKDESVSITLTRPDGSQERTTQTYDGSTALAYSLAMAYGMQLGDYSLAFESPSGKVTHNFKVVWPTEPGMATTEGKKYFVYGFQPGEHVLVLAYQKSSDALRLSSWREITMDEHGELLLDDQFKDDLLAVAGDTSGPVWSSWMLGVFIDKNLYFEQVKPCSGAPASRLQPFSFASVTPGLPNNVRSAPSLSALLVGTIQAVRELMVQRNAPVCADGLLWWQIVPRDGKGPKGWTAEGGGSNYWLAPLQ